MKSFFRTIDFQRIADLIRTAEWVVCYAGQRAKRAFVQAMVVVAGRLGIEMVTVTLDLDNIDAVRALREAGIPVKDAPSLRTIFDRIEKGGNLSSKNLDDGLKKIRKYFTLLPDKGYARAMLKEQKPIFEKRLATIKANLEAYQKNVTNNLQGQIDISCQKMIDYYPQRGIDRFPDSLLGHLLHLKPIEEDMLLWLNDELDRVFPITNSLIQNMHLDIRYEEVTMKTLNRESHLESVRKASPRMDWDKSHADLRVTGETERER